jgi:ZIP family zinc transporter
MLDAWTFAAIATAAALASPVGGVAALWFRPTSLFTSVAVGFAGGALLAAIGSEMLPKAIELGSLATAVLGFLAGVAAVYGLDLYIHRGRIAGPKADEHERVERYHRWHRPRGGEVTVLAGGTSAEELIEGLSIGVGTAIDPSLGMIVAFSIMVDNVSEALSIGELIRSEEAADAGRPWRRILGWTGLIGVALLSSALVGWFLLRGMPQSVLGPLLATGAGGMFYLTITDLVPESEERSYQQSGALSVAAGFTTIFLLSNLM